MLVASEETVLVPEASNLEKLSPRRPPTHMVGKCSCVFCIWVPIVGGPRTTADVFINAKTDLLKPHISECLAKQSTRADLLKHDLNLENLNLSKAWVSSVATRLQPEAGLRLLGTAREGFF